MKEVIQLITVAVIALFMQSCKTNGYVAVRPASIETVRPVRPGVNHVWVDGDWRWDRQTRHYNWHSGYWHAPYRGHIYTPGRWQTTERGHRWVAGRWRRQQ